MQGQRRRYVEHFVQTNRTRLLYRESEIRRPSRRRFSVYRQSDRRGKQLSTREDRTEARSCAADRGWQQLQTDVQDAWYVICFHCRHN